ncbi:hypothetical protein SAMN05421813_1132 [Daejeonella rubra]|uniref:Uncharacterized protein n=1 Tax=Daejeonella rubra TaxID=990371 RepID=A0A1G9TG57_9SPHI|nr:hypothetical protein [Daejeonella rubra]SDM46484.1 hypothetical protein SAMN05421813_1132 [Daejeonella rubra]
MKANHNYVIRNRCTCNVVVNISSSKNESKSQLIRIATDVFWVVVNISSSKNESKSQLASKVPLVGPGCCKYQ